MISSSKEQQDLETLVANSRSPISDKHKIRVYELLNHFKQDPEDYGAIIVLGYTPRMKKHIKPMDDDVFEGNQMSIYDPGIEERLKQALDNDGAILVSIVVDEKGEEDAVAMSSGNYLRVDPVKFLKRKKVPNGKPMSDRFKFIVRSGTRNCCSKASSEKLPYTSIYALSEEHQITRMFERGYTISSPYAEEIDVPEEVPSFFRKCVDIIRGYFHLPTLKPPRLKLVPKYT